MSLLLLLSGTAAATLTCSGGSVSLVGNEATLRVGRKVVAGTGAIRLETNIATSVFSDDFNRANAANLGANWNITQGAFAISSNKVYGGITDYRSIALPTANYSSNQGAKITVSGDFVDSADHVGVGVRLSSGAAQDYRNWTELDPTSVLSRVPSLVTISGMNAVSGTGVHGQWYDGGTNWKTGDFWSSVGPVTVTAALNDTSRFIVASVTTTNTNGADSANENRPSIQIRWIRTTTNPRLELVQFRSTDNLTSSPIVSDFYQGTGVGVNTPFYLEFERVGSVANCRIYSDASHLTLVDTLTITLTEVVSFRYFYVAGKSSTGSSATVSATIGPVNFDTPQTGYIFRGDGFSDNTRTLRRLSYGNLVAIGAPALPIIDGDIVEVTAVDSLISVYINNILKYSVIDTAYTSGKPGIMYEWSNTRDVFIDDFYSWNISGSANLKASRTLSCATATYTEDLKPANLLATRRLVADTQTYAEDLKSANLYYGRVLLASVQNYSLVGIDTRRAIKITAGGSVYRVKTEVDGSALFTDTITQANGTILGDTAQWDRWDTDVLDTINSNGTNAFITTVNRTSVGVIVASVSFGPDQWAEHTHQSNASGRWTAGPLVRASSGLTTNGYSFLNDSGNGDTNPSSFRLVKYVNGTLTTIANSGHLAFGPVANNATYTMRLEVVGDRLYGYIDGRLIVTGRDSTFTSGQPGFQIIYGGSTISFSAGQIDPSNTALIAGRKLLAAQVSYALNGQPVALTYTQGAKVLTASVSSYTVNPVTVNLKVSRTLSLAQTSYNLSGIPVNLKVSRTLSLAQTSYNLSGIPVSLRVGRRLFAAQATFTISTTDTPIRLTRKLVATTQSYSLSGSPVNLFRGLRISLVAQAFTLTGPPANTLVSRKFAATTQSYTLSGVPVGLKIARKLSATVQSYSVNGNNLNILVGRKLSATSQSYTLNGNQAGLIIGRRLSATVQSYTINPIAANLKRTFRLPATQQSYALSGIPVGISKIGAVILAATSSSISISSSQVGLRVSRRISLSAGQYNIAGNSVGTLRGIRLIAASSTYTLNTVPANLNRGRRLSLSAGAITLNTSVLNILRGRRLVATQQTYTFNGNSAGLLATRRISLSVYSASINTNPTNLPLGRRLIAAQQTYNLSPNAAGVKYGRRIGLAQQTYSLNYSELIFTRGGFIKVWNGSAWVSKPLKVWNGTAWVSKPLKVWTGSTWRTY